MKRFLVSILTLCLAFGVASPGIASSNKKDSGEKKQVVKKNQLKLSKKDEERLIQLGYTKEQIETMTPEEYEEVKNENAVLVGSVEEYYQVEEGKKPVKVSKQKALKEVKEYKEKMMKKEKNAANGVAAFADEDPSTTSWMKMVTSVSRYVDDAGEPTGRYRFKHDFDWLTDPVWELTDVIGITHHDFFTYEQDSERYKYYYSRYFAGDYKDTLSIFDTTADKKSSEGLAFKVDLVSEDSGYIVKDHDGYMYYKVYLNDWSRNSGNVYGHYTHAEGSVAGLTINLFTGHMSVSGMLKQSEMPDTGIELTPLP